MIKTLTEISLGKKGFILSYSLQSIPEFKVGIQNQKLKQRLQEAYCLMACSSGLFSLLSSTPQGLLPRDGTSYRGMGPFTLIIYQ